MDSLELIKELHPFLWPTCILIIAFLFRKEIRSLLNRVGNSSYRTDEINRQEDLPEEHDFKPVDNINTDKSACIQASKVDDDSGNELIQVRRNINSDKYFIVLDENDDKIYCIPPEGKIDWKETKIFHDTETISEEIISKQNPSQLEMYYWYVQNPEQGVIPIPHIQINQTYSNGNLPIYLQNYINMLKNPVTIPSRMLECIRQNPGVQWGTLKDTLHKDYGYSPTSGSMDASLKALQTLNCIYIKGQGDSKTIYCTKEEVEREKDKKK